MNRFVQIGRYVPLGNMQPINEMLDTKTGIVYMCSDGGDGADVIAPILFDNGKPQHLNKEEVDKIKKMISEIGETRYQKVCQDGYDDDFYTSFLQREWTIDDVYKKLCKK